MVDCPQNRTTDMKGWWLPCRHLYYKSSLSRKDRGMLNRAIELARTSDCRHRHGAVLVDGGRVLSFGVNSNKNDPMIVGDELLEKSVHAEIAALRRHKGPLHNATIYVARVGRRDTPLMSKPCKNCQKALKDAGVTKVVYTVDNEMDL